MEPKNVEGVVSSEAADYLKVEGREAALILTYLAARPADWALTLALAEFDAKIQAPNKLYGMTVDDRERARVGAWLRLARFGWCEGCYFPTVLYPSGLLMDWPSFREHACAPGQQETPERRVAQRPTPARPSIAMAGRGLRT